MNIWNIRRSAWCCYITAGCCWGGGNRRSAWCCRWPKICRGGTEKPQQRIWREKRSMWHQSNNKYDMSVLTCQVPHFSILFDRDVWGFWSPRLQLYTDLTCSAEYRTPPHGWSCRQRQLFWQYLFIKKHKVVCCLSLVYSVICRRTPCCLKREMAQRARSRGNSQIIYNTLSCESMTLFYHQNNVSAIVMS